MSRPGLPKQLLKFLKLLLYKDNHQINQLQLRHPRQLLVDFILRPRLRWLNRRPQPHRT
jgi:hypothetical protein